jgi:hypothetical protein
MNNKGFIVTVIDKRDDERRKGFVNAFKDEALIQQVYFDDARSVMDIVCRSADNRDILTPKPPNITFLHVRDRDLIDEKKIRPEYGKLENIVFYGGSGGNDSEISSNAKERIWRVISGGSGSISPEEVIHLREYFNLPPGNRNDHNRPEILLPQKTFEILSTLSILCQGYLAVCAKSEERGDCWNDIEPALEQMGWTVFINKGAGKSLIKGNLGGKLPEVQKAGWWYEGVFDAQNDKTSPSPEKWDNLKKTLASECGRDRFEEVNDEIQKLFNDITTENKKIEPSTVANAYCAISGVLTDTTLLE